MAANQAQARRIFLTQRLVNKQITMEEATELFTLMSRENEGLRRALSSLPPPPPPPGVPRPPTRGRPASADLTSMNVEDLLLFGAPMVAILAALVKKSGLDQFTAPPPAAEKKPSTPAKKSTTSG